MRFNGSGDDAENLGNAVASRETSMALFVKGEFGELWIPKSVIHDDSEVFDACDNREGNLIVKRWFAEKESLA